MKTPVWYYLENGHRWRKVKGSDAINPSVKRVCTYCGVTSRHTDGNYKIQIKNTLFVCRDRQSMLFPGGGARVGGWANPDNWNTFS